jgi:hypothetical protein
MAHGCRSPGGRRLRGRPTHQLMSIGVGAMVCFMVFYYVNTASRMATSGVGGAATATSGFNEVSFGSYGVVQGAWFQRPRLLITQSRRYQIQSLVEGGAAKQLSSLPVEDGRAEVLQGLLKARREELEMYEYEVPRAFLPRTINTPFDGAVPDDQYKVSGDQYRVGM